MAYEPTTWKSGDVVTSAKLNKLENGVKDAGPLMIGFSVFGPNGETLDHTWQQIHDAMVSGRLVVAFHVVFDGESVVNVNTWPVSGSYIGSNVNYGCIINGEEYITDSPDGYPHIESGILTPDDPVG